MGRGAKTFLFLPVIAAAALLAPAATHAIAIARLHTPAADPVQGSLVPRRARL
jgi:hypothetical protein